MAMAVGHISKDVNVDSRAFAMYVDLLASDLLKFHYPGSLYGKRFTDKATCHTEPKRWRW